jgi:23S rRNA (guanosine2251-2'-O)-methyltransferase
LQTEIVAGINAVLESLRSSSHGIVELLVSRSSRDQRVKSAIGLARRNGIKVTFQSKERLSSLAPGLNHQGLIAISLQRKYSSLEEIVRFSFHSETPSLILVLDHIQDPHNLGAVIRTGEVAGAHGVIIPKRRAVHITSAVAKASSGAVEHISVAVVSNIAQALERLKREGIWTIGLAGDAPDAIYKIDLTMPLAFVVGREDEGLHKLVADRCDILASIPMFGKVDSLNVSVAAGVAIYEAVRQRLYSP